MVQTSDQEGQNVIHINKESGWKSRKTRTENKNANAEEHQNEVMVNLGDCLACNGCITSAEAVLISEQSHDKLLKILEEKEKVLINK